MADSSSSNATRHCSQCGTALRAGAGFCTACGAPVAGHGQAPAPRSTAPATRMAKPWLAIGLVLALAAVALIFLLLQQESSETATVPAALPTVAAANPNVPYPNVPRVSPEQAHMSAMSNEAVIVDVRGREFYDAGHARGAISIPLEELPARFSELPKDKAILFYCT